jgi:16S rRNA (guanine527-N7)-methyltransferase
MQPARIAELLNPFFDKANGRRPTANDLENISTYIDILLRWNARINLTAIRDPEQIVTRHFGESFFAARHLFPLFPSVTSVVRPTVADIGSGAGFPGLPLKLWVPAISLTLIEANHKKATFLREVSRTLALTEVNVVAARAETLPEATYDVITLRAVERFETILPVAARLVSSAGRLALLIGSSQLAAAQSRLPDLIWSDPLPIPGSSARVLAVATRK